ncbi:MAG: tripartite tricarboxylate transporter substrate binding protein [Burkholderiales bacterium]
MRSRVAAVRALACLGLMLAANAALAQEFPARPVQLLNSFPPGSIIDVMGRAFAQSLDTVLPQKTVVVNRPGGSQTIAINALAQAPADGYTWLYTAVTPITIQPHRMKLSYTREMFIPVCQAFENIFYVAVAPGSPHRAFQSLIDHARANPGKVKYGTAGIGSSPHLAGAELFLRAGVKMVDVPYQAPDASMLTSMQAGDLESAIVTTFSLNILRLRGLAVFATERTRSFPDVPTTAEFGHTILPSGYGGIFVRQETPPAILAKIEDACRRATNDPAYRDFAEKQFQSATYLDRKAFGDRVEADYRAKAALIPTLNLPAQ